MVRSPVSKAQIVDPRRRHASVPVFRLRMLGLGKIVEDDDYGGTIERLSRVPLACIIWRQKTGRYYIFLVAQGHVRTGDQCSKIRSKPSAGCLSPRASGSLL